MDKQEHIAIMQDRRESFQKERIDIELRNKGVELDDSQPGMVRATPSSDDVSLGFNCDGDEKAVISATFDREVAREISSAVRNNQSAEWETDSTLMVLDYAWLRHEYPTGGKDASSFTLSVETESGLCKIEGIYDAGHEGTVRMSTSFSGSELEELATGIEEVTAESERMPLSREELEGRVDDIMDGN